MTTVLVFQGLILSGERKWQLPKKYVNEREAIEAST